MSKKICKCNSTFTNVQIDLNVFENDLSTIRLEQCRIGALPEIGAGSKHTSTGHCAKQRDLFQVERKGEYVAVDGGRALTRVPFASVNERSIEMAAVSRERCTAPARIIQLSLITAHILRYLVHCARLMHRLFACYARAISV